MRVNLQRKHKAYVQGVTVNMLNRSHDFQYGWSSMLAVGVTPLYLEVVFLLCLKLRLALGTNKPFAEDSRFLR